jgi:protein SCO1
MKKTDRAPVADTVRRRLIGTGAVALVAPHLMGPVTAHETFGPVRPPLPAPVIALTATDGKALDLSQGLRGSVTALQLMFVGCSATCPIQGAIFADAQRKLAGAGADMRLLSVSIDPLGDDLKALREWLGRFGALSQRWTAALPRVQDVNRLLDFLRARTSGVDRHTTQAYLFDRSAQLVYRTGDMPAGDELVKLMRQVGALP